MKCVTQPYKPVDHVQEIKQLRVDRFELIGVMIPQNVVNIPQRNRHIYPLDPVYRRQVFPGINI